MDACNLDGESGLEDNTIQTEYANSMNSLGRVEIYAYAHTGSWNLCRLCLQGTSKSCESLQGTIFSKGYRKRSIF